MIASSHSGWNWGTLMKFGGYLGYGGDTNEIKVSKIYGL
jgi:hypothetical protein